MNNSITLIDGIRVGHAQDEKALTGCTVVLCEKGAIGGVDQRGGAPGTRETDALQPVHLVDRVHAIMLAGGSAFGLDTASGAVRYLEERKVGFNVGVAKVPIVPAAILFDLGIGSAKRRPDAKMGYQACLNASRKPPAEGNAGAGMGATVGKILGMKQATKSGIGTAAMEIGGGVQVAAIVAVNAFGDVIDPDTGEIVAGARSLKKGPIRIGTGTFADTMQVMRTLAGRSILALAQRGNTVIGVVTTNAKGSSYESGAYGHEWDRPHLPTSQHHDGWRHAVRYRYRQKESRREYRRCLRRRSGGAGDPARGAGGQGSRRPPGCAGPLT